MYHDFELENKILKLIEIKQFIKYFIYILFSFQAISIVVIRKPVIVNFKVKYKLNYYQNVIKVKVLKLGKKILLSKLD